ncbi:phosphoribosylformylglycinamidine synthase subunit PurS [Candidatus Mycalebacterium sp.]
MKNFEVKIEIRPAKGVLDPQGKTVLSALGKLGFSEVVSVTVGKLIELRVECSDEKSAQVLADRMCSEILANPVIEVFSIEVAEARSDG